MPLLSGAGALSHNRGLHVPALSLQEKVPQITWDMEALGYEGGIYEKII